MEKLYLSKQTFVVTPSNFKPVETSTDGNRIASISKPHFQSTTNLVQLNLMTNKLSSISYDTFEILTSLEELSFGLKIYENTFLVFF